MTPTAEVRAELEALLTNDTSRTGDVYRLLNDDLNDQQIAERLYSGIGHAGAPAAPGQADPRAARVPT